MTSVPSAIPRFLLRVLSVALIVFSPSLRAQEAATGAIEGRVLNTGNGAYLDKARISVEGTSLETLTDQLGHYRLGNVPVGNMKLKIFFTGFGMQTDTVVVVAGQTVPHDVTLTSGGKSTAAGDSPIKLTEVVVKTSREMEGTAIAINEQRFASDIKNVVSSDEFGFVPDGNLGEFTKFLPGIAINYAGGEGRSISVNGVPAQYVPITVGGFSLASAASSGTGRTTELEQVSINNVSRIEVVFSATPDSPGSSLGGTVNLVPRSAFERARPLFTMDVSLNARANDTHFRESPGPLTSPTKKVHPGFNFTYINPVNKRFGFSVSGSTIVEYSPQDFIALQWRGTNNATNGTTLPDTTPDQPYLTAVSFRDGAKNTQRTSFATTVDYKFAPRDRLSLSFQYAFFDAEFSNRVLNYNVNAVPAGGFSPSFTHGTVGAGELNTGNTSARDKSGTTFMPSLTWRHDGPVWKMEVGAGISQASNHYRDVEKGYFSSPVIRRSGVTINLDNNSYLRPERIAVIDGTTGATVDPNSLTSYVITSAGVNPLDGHDIKRTFFGHATRSFDWKIPVILKAGFDVRESVRDVRGANFSYNFVGPNNATPTTPTAPGGSANVASQVLDEGFSSRWAPFGFGQVQWVDNRKLWNLYKEHPTWFTVSDNTVYRSYIGTSKHVSERVSAFYLRADAFFFHRRLKVVGGVRGEVTLDRGEGPLTDATLNYQRDASGRILHDAAGAPIPIVSPSDALGVSRRTFLDRGTHAEKEYLRYFPSLNASFNVTANLVTRAAYSQSIGRPDFNQYAGGLSLPDTDRAPSATNRIGVNNVRIQPWKAESVLGRVEYYFEKVGVLSAGGFYRDITNFFGSTVFPATPQFLEQYGVDPATYGAYDVATQTNLTTPIHMSGFDVNYKQALTFLPSWAHGVVVFGNLSRQRIVGPVAAVGNLAGFVPLNVNWGVSLSREKYNLRVNWNYRGKQRNGSVTGRSIESGVFNYASKRLYIDVNADCALSKNWRAFLSVRNLDDATEDVKVYGPKTPKIATFTSREDFHPLWNLGVKATY